MSKWTDVRDNVVDSFCAATKEQSKTEAGWCKIRDGIVLPIIMQGGVYVVKLVLSKTVSQTTAA